jgi:hypothetical protein
MRLQTRLVAGKAGDDGAVQAASDLLGAGHGEAARLRVLCIGQDRLAAAAHALVGTERGEDDELPGGAAVLGRIVVVTAPQWRSAAWAARMAGTVPQSMTARCATTTSGSSSSAPSSSVSVK